MKKTEQRACRRYDVPGITTKVIQEISPRFTQNPTTCSVNNLGKGGVQFMSQARYKVGEVLNIEIQGKDAETISAQAEVRHKNQDQDIFEYGMRFSEIDISLLRQVRQLCSRTRC
jgi:hypothetical protein